MVAKWSVNTSIPGSSGDGMPRGTSPTVDTPRSARSNRFDASSPPTTRTRAPGIFGATYRSTRIVARAMAPTRSVVPWVSPTVSIQLSNFCQLFSPDASVPVSFGSSPTTTSIAAPNRKPVITALDRNRETQPILRRASRTKKAPAINVIAATSAGASSSGSPDVTTAPAATAASAELGPVEIWRDVPKMA
jgi:hypothetical protein